jgi:hypothetical protein
MQLPFFPRFELSVIVKTGFPETAFFPEFLDFLEFQKKLGERY